jgi:hypothetical protein
MGRGFRWLCGAVLASAVISPLAPAFAPPAFAQGVTFYRDVLPILQRNCQDCHRPGEIGPMSLLTYDDARRSASRISEALTIGKMPPWFADPGVNHFANDRTLSPADQKTLFTWLDSGQPAGNPKEAPPPRSFTQGWEIGQPDLVVELPNAFKVPAHGVLEYQYIVLPLHFTEDKWVEALEVRPGNRAVVHHVIALLREPGSKWTFNNGRHRYNPDPTATVRWGDQTWEEMALMSFQAVVPMNTRGQLLMSASGR